MTHAPVWPPQGYVTISGAAALLGLERQRVYVLVRTLQIPTHETDGGRLLALADVERLRRRNTQRGRPRQREE